MSDIYLSITETPAVVTLSQAVISGALSSTVTVANTVTVALDANSLSALENVTVTVGSAVSVSGTVTANVYRGQWIKLTFTGEFSGIYYLERTSELSWNTPDIATLDYGGSISISFNSNEGIWEFFLGQEGLQARADFQSPLPPQTGWGDFDSINSLEISYLNPYTLPISGTVTIGNSVTVGVAGVRTVLVSGAGYSLFNGIYIASAKRTEVSDGPFANTRISYYASDSDCTIEYRPDNRWHLVTAGGTGTYMSTTTGSYYPVGLTWQNDPDSGNSYPPYPSVSRLSEICVSDAKISSGTVTANLSSTNLNSVTIGVRGTVTVGSLPVQLSTTTIGETARLNVTLSSATTVGATAPSYANLYGGSDGTNLRAISVDSSGRTVVTGATSILGTASVTIGAISGTVTANNPNGSLTTRFGSVTTANTAQITSAVTNTSRRYLLAQNISSGTVTIGIGFTPTTTQGIQLAAGAGMTFDSFCPTGAVWWLGAVTGASWTILEG